MDGATVEFRIAQNAATALRRVSAKGKPRWSKPASARAGHAEVRLELAQRMARHSDDRLTDEIYTDGDLLHEVDASKSLVPERMRRRRPTRVVWYGFGMEHSTPPPTSLWSSPADLADRLDSACATLGVPLGLSQNALHTAATETFLLSLRREEGRDLRPQVCVLGHDNIGNVAVQLKEFKPFKANDVHKIAPCVPGGQFAFLLRATGDLVETVGWLRIERHRLATGGSEFAHLHFEGGAWFRVLGPGTIEAWSSNLAAVRGPRGDRFRQGGCFRLIGGLIEDVEFGFHHAATEVGLMFRPRHTLLRAIPLAQRAAHGGTFAVLPQGANVAELLDPSKGVFQSIRRQVVPASGSVLATEFHEPPDSATVERLLDEIRCLADLSSADGAVVLESGMRPVGFAAQISADTGGRINGMDVGPTRRGPVNLSEIHGTRHASAARLCSKLPGTTAVVISQDGGVTLLRSEEDSQLVQRYGPFVHVPMYDFYTPAT